MVPAPLRAQDHASAPDEPPHRDVGRVHILEDDAGEISGRLIDFSGSWLTLIVEGEQRQLELSRIQRIDVRGDSVKNGAVIGGVVLGAWCAWLCGQGLEGAGQMVPAVLANTLLGALIGAGIDGLRVGRTTIYRRPGGAPGRDRRLGLALGFRF